MSTQPKTPKGWRRVPRGAAIQHGDKYSSLHIFDGWDASNGANPHFSAKVGDDGFDCFYIRRIAAKKGGRK